MIDVQRLILKARWAANAKRLRKIERLLRSEFDAEFYLDTYPDVISAGVSPLRHFILQGWREGNDPNGLFSTTAYLRLNPDVARHKMNPFVHYLLHGREEGRSVGVSQARQNALQKPDRPLAVPAMPTASAWSAAPRRLPAASDDSGTVDVIVPVYGGLEETAAAIYAVLVSRNDRPIELIVVNDCSPEPAIGSLMRELAASGHLRLIENETNLGFAASVNRGMREHAGRDVVLLNADTIVQDGWIDRIVAHAERHSDIATITPLSNNATICSYPDFAADNPFELGESAAELDRLAAEANAGCCLALPTGVGFCMYIRRAALDDVGLFDVERFGRGYGEENDFCVRALKRGWRNVLAADVYVRHFGSVSFGDAQPEKLRVAQLTLAERHPDYPDRVKRHIQADPALSARIRLDIVRLRESLGSVSVLFLTHNWGGGIETYLDNLRALLLSRGRADIVRTALIGRVRRDGFFILEPFAKEAAAQQPYLPNLAQLNAERHKDLLADLFRLLRPGLIHVNSFAGLSDSSIARLMNALEASGQRYWHIWHDHQPLCPRVNFVDVEARYCGEFDTGRCAVCLSASDIPREWVDIDAWRGRFRDYLAAAERVIAPSAEAAVRAARLADGSKIEIRPHPEPHLVDEFQLPRDRSRGRAQRRVAILGAIGPHKGVDLLNGMIRHAEEAERPIFFDVVGYTSLKSIGSGPNSAVHGRYRTDADAIRTLRKVRPDIFFLPSIWPETFVYTLSIAFALGLPVVAFDLGAQGERVRAYPRGHVLDPLLREDPIAVTEALLALDIDSLWRVPLAPGAGINIDAAVDDLIGRSAAPVAAPAMPRVAV